MSSFDKLDNDIKTLAANKDFADASDVPGSTVQVTASPSVRVGPPPATAFNRSYNTFSGTDIKFNLKFRDGTLKRSDAIACVTWDSVDKNEVILTSILFEGDEMVILAEDQGGLDNIRSIILQAVNEYGTSMHCEVEVSKYLGERFGVTTDDILSEIHHYFTLSKINGWKKGRYEE